MITAALNILKILARTNEVCSIDRSQGVIGTQVRLRVETMTASSLLKYAITVHFAKYI
jgi:hypothetical protein